MLKTLFPGPDDRFIVFFVPTTLVGRVLTGLSLVVPRSVDLTRPLGKNGVTAETLLGGGEDLPPRIVESV